MEESKEKAVTDSGEDGTRVGQAKHDDHFYLVKILPEFIGFPLELHVEESKEKAVTDSGEDEQDNGGGRQGG